MSDSSARKRKDKPNKNGIIEETNHKRTNTHEGSHRRNSELSPSWTSIILFFILFNVVSLLFAVFLLEIHGRKSNSDITHLEQDLIKDEILLHEPPTLKTEEFKEIVEEEKEKIKRVLTNRDINQNKENEVNSPSLKASAQASTSEKDESEPQDKKVSKKFPEDSETLKVNPKDKKKGESSEKMEIEPLDRPLKDANVPVLEKRSEAESNNEDRKLLRDLYIEVEGLADDILSRDPKNEMLKILAPHLEKVLKDMENGKYSGVEDALIKAQETLEAVRQRISEKKEGDSKEPLSAEDLKDVKQILENKTASERKEAKSEPKGTSDDPKSTPGGKNEEKDSFKTDNGDKIPVEEIIPDPIYVTPLGDMKTDESTIYKAEESHKHIKKDNIADLKVKKAKNDPEPSILKKLEEAKKLENEDPLKSLNIYEDIVERFPNSFSALHGRAKLIDSMAEKEKSNSRLEQAIQSYLSILDLAEKNREAVDSDVYREIGLTCATRMAFRGWQSKSIQVLQRLASRFPEDTTIQNKLGVAFLLLNQPKPAIEFFKRTLELKPNDGYAQVHYGFILKTTFGNYTEGAKYLAAGIKSGDDGTLDGRFYFHLGDALQRLGQNEAAYKIYDQGVEKGLFMSRYQRSLYNVERLTSRPVWTAEQTTYAHFFRKLESHWHKIRDEALRILSDNMTKGFSPENENLREKGDWRQFYLFTRGKKHKDNCLKAPKTCALIENFAPAATCKRGQAKFSLMHGDTHIWAHTGPTNCRLRAHLGLVIPSGLKLRVQKDYLQWREGKVIIFDDSFEHEVWHEGSSPRLVLIVDVWHPELSESVRKSLTAI